MKPINKNKIVYIDYLIYSPKKNSVDINKSYDDNAKCSRSQIYMPSIIVNASNLKSL